MPQRAVITPARSKKPAGPVRVTASMFYKYLRCPHWIYWDTFGNVSEKRKLDEFTEKIWEHGLVHERETLTGFGPLHEIAEYGDEDELVGETLAAMREGKKAIYHGRLVDGTWVGIPDLLVKTELAGGRQSRFGSYLYEPYDIKSARIVDPKDIRDEYRFQLAFYALILEKIQGIRPERGHIVDAEGELHEVNINSVLEDFHLTLKEIEKILSGKKPAPFLASACKESPWFELCKKDAERCDDICLIYKIGRADHARLYEAGVRTVTELANADADMLEEAVSGMSRRKIDALIRQAKSLHTGETIVIQSPEFPPGETEVYFDIEGDPLRNIEYLFGLLVVKGLKSKGVCKKFMAPTPAAEHEAWREFLAFVKTLPEIAPIYHYGSYERTVVARFYNRYGGDVHAYRKLERNMINMLTIVCESVALPVYFYSLKDIAKEIGFRWRHSKASGVNSIMWYEKYLDLVSKKKKAKAQDVLNDILEYNEDDVRATLHLKRYLAALPAPH